MPGAIEEQRVEDSGRNSYDVRIRALETNVAVISNSFATKDDVQALRAEMHAGHERILTLIYETKIELLDRMNKQGEELQGAMAKQREEFYAALATQREDFYTALAKQREDFHTALAKQREDFYTALAETKLDLHKALMGHLWKLYGFASLMLGGVYFIARYVH
ncbi:hypothetical protein ACXZ1M_26450 [Duganella sp. PWIR1]